MLPAINIVNETIVEFHQEVEVLLLTPLIFGDALTPYLDFSKHKVIQVMPVLTLKTFDEVLVKLLSVEGRECWTARHILEVLG